LLNNFADAAQFPLAGKLLIFRHNAMPFGAVSAVYEWDRIGSLFCVNILPLLFALLACRLAPKLFCKEDFKDPAAPIC